MKMVNLYVAFIKIKMKKNIYFLCSLVLVSILLLTSLLSACNINWTDTSTIEGDVLNLYGDDPYTLDPALAGDSVSIDYVLQIFSGLVTLDDEMKPVDDIAESWKISDDNLVYTFYLREGVYFHDGRKVTAQDFKYSWERACNPSLASQTAVLYLGDILGVDEVLAGTNDEITGVEVINDYTLQVMLEKPVTYFLEKLSYPVTFVVDKNNISEGDDWWASPNGTGAFKLRNWDEGSELVLERNNDYYGDVALLDFVVFKILSGAEMDMYETGEIDVCNVGLSYIYKATDEGGEFYDELSIVPELSLSYICFNCSQSPFDDPNIRLAFSMAIDKAKIISLVFNDIMEQADGIIPVGMPGYNDELVSPGYDVALALDLIANSSYGDVSNLPEIIVTDGGYGGQISSLLEAIINEWRVNLGVEVTVRQLEPDEFLYSISEEKDQMFLWGWSADYPHPQDFLEILFASYSEGNYGEYSNFEVDALLKQAGTQKDEELSLELYQQAEQILVNDAACIPLYFGNNYVLVKSYIKGYELNPLGFAMLNKVYFEN